MSNTIDLERLRKDYKGCCDACDVRGIDRVQAEIMLAILHTLIELKHKGTE